MSFLQAEWRKLVMANYRVDPKILSKYIPPHTELDLWEGKCLISLVGFMFVNTRVLGLAIPLYRNFEEVNLRFYVRYFDSVEWKRGVVFIKEFVPRHAITFIANSIYKEHYETMKMLHYWVEESDHRIVQYKWGSHRLENNISVKASLEKEDIQEQSETEFITEHYWGYTKNSEQTTYEYEVKHPRWKVYEVYNSEINVDFGSLYGEEFKELSTQTPDSVLLAEGSEISVENKSRIGN